MYHSTHALITLMLRYVYGRSDIQDESIYEPEFRSEVIVNATSQMENFSIYDVSLVIDNLVEDALSNPVVCHAIKLLFMIIIIDIILHLS